MLCDPSIYKPLEIINALKLVFFRLNGKKVTSFPTHKKGGQTDIEKLSSSVAATYLLENP